MTSWVEDHVGPEGGFTLKAMIVMITAMTPSLKASSLSVSPSLMLIVLLRPRFVAPFLPHGASPVSDPRPAVQPVPQICKPWPQ